MDGRSKGLEGKGMEEGGKEKKKEEEERREGEGRVVEVMKWKTPVTSKGSICSAVTQV